MAKIKPGALGTLIGRLGNASYYDSPLGPIVRVRNKPKKTDSNSASVSHQMFGLTSDLWAKLTIDQAKKWKDLAYSIKYKDKVGNILHKRGRDLFRSVNLYRLGINQVCIFDPPRKIYPHPLSSFDVDIFGTNKLNDIKLHFKPAIKNDTIVNIYATKSLSTGVNFIKPCWYKKIGFIDSRFKTGGSILNLYNKVFFGHYVPGYRIAFMLKPVSAISGFPGEIISLLESPIF